MTYSRAVAERLLRWQSVLRRSLTLQAPPSEPRPVLPLECLRSAQADQAYAQLSPEQLQCVASRLVVLNRIDHTLETTERRWQALLQ